MSLFRPSKSKTKSAVIVGTFDGRTITDRRFEVGQWPVAFEVETPYADAWLTYFAMECEQRGWSCTNLAQLGARENSGSFTIGISGTNSATLVWERRKNKPLKIKARVEQHASLQLAELQSALSATNASCRAAQLTRVYCRGQLEYDGLPWRGELWLDDALRLGPASREYEEALIGPRVIVVDAEIEGIDQRSARERFQIRLRELAVFLSVVARLHVVPHRQPRSGWTWNLADGTPHCEVRQVGYLETSVASEMPSRSTCSPVPTREVRRPDLERRGIASADTEQWIPADLVDLWAAFRALPENERKQFLQAANLWHCAQNIGHEFQTTRFALIVASGEALKPRGKEFRELTLYHVVAGLLGQECADLLRENWVNAESTRNLHLHAGDLLGNEFQARDWMASFVDPSFRHAIDALYKIVAASFVEWLRRGGQFTPTINKRSRRVRRRFGRIATGAIGFAIGMAIGVVLSYASS